MIRTFADRDCRRLFEGRPSKRYSGIRAQAERRLTILDAATSLADLSGLPSNRLEALEGDRAGKYSIRINDQWRICFEWNEDGADEVEIVDYH